MHIYIYNLIRDHSPGTPSLSKGPPVPCRRPTSVHPDLSLIRSWQVATKRACPPPQTRLTLKPYTHLDVCPGTRLGTSTDRPRGRDRPPCRRAVAAEAKPVAYAEIQKQRQDRGRNEARPEIEDPTETPCPQKLRNLGPTKYVLPLRHLPF